MFYKYSFFVICTMLIASIGYIFFRNKNILSLKERGSFYIGGEKVNQDFIELGSQREADTVTINQMYVEYMIPAGKNKIPVILAHGAGMTGNCYDTTPDGRMGWYEYFVRNAFPTYVADQVGRGRSGFNQAVFNNVSAGRISPDNQPKITRMGDVHAAWINFRIGPKEGVAYPETKFPIEAINELSKMSISDLSQTLPQPNPNYKALAELAEKLNGAVVIGHSQSGHFPLEAALQNPKAVKGMVLLEPGSCFLEKFTDEEFSILAKIPLLVMYGDHLEGSIEIPNNSYGWQQRFNDCNKLIERINNAGGQAEMLHLPAKGLYGNTHMFMQDKNNLQVADFIINWIKDKVN